MTPTEAVKLAYYIQSHFPSQPINEGTPDALWELLQQYDVEDCRRAVLARALRLQNTEGQKWCTPTDVYAEVRRIRAKNIAEDEALHLPPHDPDDPQSYIAALKASREASAAGRPMPAPQGLQRGLIRELGGPVRRVNELDDEERAKYADALREQRKAALRELAEQPEAEPDPPPTFACEYPVGEDLCGKPAPHLSPDRRRPLCGDHRPMPEHETELESA